MSIADSLLVGLIVMTIVFVVLVALSLMINGISLLVKGMEKARPAEASAPQPVETVATMPVAVDGTSGTLRLIGVDEQTAAMVMAIISDELKIPLNQLEFVSIRALD